MSIGILPVVFYAAAGGLALYCPFPFFWKRNCYSPTILDAGVSDLTNERQRLDNSPVGCGGGHPEPFGRSPQLENSSTDCDSGRPEPFGRSPQPGNSSADCCVCLESFGRDRIIAISPCAHKFCAECIREHISTVLSGRRFPVLCPMCAADRSTQEPTGTPRSHFTLASALTYPVSPLALDYRLAQRVGITEEQSEIWAGLETISFSITVQCQR
jgi:Ring finger domain